jgi:hypothetical protein
MLTECEAVLTDTQKQLLSQRRQTSPRLKRAKAATTPKASEKAGG